MGFEKGDNCEVCQLGKAESTSVGGSTPTWWLPICCPCNKTTLLESGFIDRYGKKIGIIIFLLKHNSILLDTWQQDSPCGTFLCHTAPLVEPWRNFSSFSFDQYFIFYILKPWSIIRLSLSAAKLRCWVQGKRFDLRKHFIKTFFVCLCKFDGMSCIVKPPDSTSVRYVRKVASRAPPDDFVLDILKQ